MKRIFVIAIFLLINAVLFPQQHLFETILRMKDSVKFENIVSHITNLQYAGGYYSRVNFTPGNDSAFVYLRDQFQLLTKNGTVTIDTFYISSATPPLNTQPLFNVTATIKGTEDSSKYYLIGAHYDASASRMGSTVWNQQWRTLKAPGADDNASGVAALLEMIRILSDTSNGYRPLYTLKLTAFGAEETGPAYSSNHHGSKYMAARASENGQHLQGMISFDMVGYNNNYLFTSVVSNSASSFLANNLREANTLFDVGLLMGSLVSSSATYSDHQSFWDAGYQALLVIENAPPWNNGPFYTANPYYHTSSDTLETLNLNLIRSVTQLNLTALAAFGSHLSTDIRDVKKGPASYELIEIYPNPFNGQAKIRFSVKNDGVVNLKVFSVTGNEVFSEMVEITSGLNEIPLNGENFSSGVYLVSLSGRDFALKSKFILLK